MIKVTNVTKGFGGRQVLRGVTFHVPRGTITVIVGTSGAGKSTLVKCLLGALKPEGGEIWIDGQEITRMSEAELDHIRVRCGVLFQNIALLQSLTVGENIALPISEHSRLDDNICKIMVTMRLEQVALSGFEDLLPSQLSGGMQKRVGIARALALDPSIVFFDEPTAGLDPVVRGVICTLIKDLTTTLGITSVVITHDITAALEIADKCVMLHEGTVCFEGTPEDMAQSADPLLQQFIAGNPEGPIPFQQSLEDYEKTLMGA